MVMTNSRYTARLIKMVWHGDALVLHPPIRIEDFKHYSDKSFDERDNAVIMIGRIIPTKRIESVIEALALSKEKPILRVVGSLMPHSLQYKAYLEKLAREKYVRIEFHTNISRDKLVKLASSSKVFVHATLYEHFGIAVVEGMAAGCPVIVHKSGGPYEDIIDYGTYGLYYESVDDLAEKIDMLMTDRKKWEYYHRMSLTRAQDFREEKFIEDFLRIVKNF